jgi:hypothetical protein
VLDQDLTLYVVDTPEEAAQIARLTLHRYGIWSFVQVEGFPDLPGFSP